MKILVSNARLDTMLIQTVNVRKAAQTIIHSVIIVMKFVKRLRAFSGTEILAQRAPRTIVSRASTTLASALPVQQALS